MAPSNSTIMFIYFLLVSIVAGTGSALKKSVGKEEAIAHHYQRVKPRSFLSSTICRPSTKSDKKRGSLKVVHKRGPCSKSSKKIVKPLTFEEILTHDQSRVNTIKSRLTTMTTTGKKDIKTSKATMPLTSGTLFESSEYVVSVGMGTPKKTQELLMDTGSDLTWTQCQPCSGSCYSQKEPIFAPSLSSTYSNIACTSPECSSLISSTGNPPGCRSSTCVYGIEYGDGSTSVGQFAKEKITLSNNDTIDNFLFGCGQFNRGSFGTTDGLLGLGRGQLSMVSQTAKRYGKVFSYCLPSMDSSKGFLTLGNGSMASNVKYTRLLKSSSFYSVEFVGMMIGQTRTQMSQPSDMVVDSGTVVTRLDSKAYSDLRKAFRAQMTQYTLTKPLSILDTCYDLSKQTDVKIPKISMIFGQNVIVDMPPQGTLIEVSPTQTCLAYAGNEADSDPIIFANLQQMTMGIVYDIPAGRVGFANGVCR